MIDEGNSEAIENRCKRKLSDHRPIYSYNNFFNPYTKIGRQGFRKIRLIFDSRKDAMKVLDDLREELEASEDYYVSVRTLYRLADLPTSNVMLNWGWYDLEDCSIAQEGDYYILTMPPVERRPEKDRDSSIS